MDVPAQYLCPPIPGRADYLHYLADLLSESNGGEIPRGKSVRVLDIGVGANCIYPLIGHATYGWQFVGTDVDAVALNNAQRILDANQLSDAVELRLQKSRTAIFSNVTKADEFFDLTLCNPPFHASLAEARHGSQRKWKNLGKENDKPQKSRAEFRRAESGAVLRRRRRGVRHTHDRREQIGPQQLPVVHHADLQVVHPAARVSCLEILRRERQPHDRNVTGSEKKPHPRVDIHG